jgi:DNA repair exonuclease SbcCD ATPase subunit
MARQSDREFSLKRKIKDLEQQNEKLELELAKLKKQINKSEESLTEKKKPGKVANKPCPDCGAELKTTDLPHAVMELCSAGCSYRNVKGK